MNKSSIFSRFWFRFFRPQCNIIKSANDRQFPFLSLYFTWDSNRFYEVARLSSRRMSTSCPKSYHHVLGCLTKESERGGYANPYNSCRLLKMSVFAPFWSYNKINSSLSEFQVHDAQNNPHLIPVIWFMTSTMPFWRSLHIL